MEGFTNFLTIAAKEFGEWVKVLALNFWDKLTNIGKLIKDDWAKTFLDFVKWLGKAVWDAVTRKNIMEPVESGVAGFLEGLTGLKTAPGPLGTSRLYRPVEHSVNPWESAFEGSNPFEQSFLKGNNITINVNGTGNPEAVASKVLNQLNATC